MSDSTAPVTLRYFALRGRGEPIRLALALAGVPWTEEVPDYAALKASAGSAANPFGQVPLLLDGDFTLAQMDAILRHIGRKHDLYGKTVEDAALIDMVLIGVESLRSAYGDLVYKQALADDAKATYKQTHFDQASVHTRNSGAHFAYFEAILSRNRTGYAVGDHASIADVQVRPLAHSLAHSLAADTTFTQLFDIVDLHLREQLFPEAMQAFPFLTAHHARIAAIPSVAAYLASDRRPAQVNGIAGRG